MIPQVRLDRRDRIVDADSTPTPLAPAARHELTEADRQGLAMGWASIALGLFALLGGLALWAAVALHAGFVGWLVSLAIVGLVVAIVLVAVTYAVNRPGADRPSRAS